MTEFKKLRASLDEKWEKRKKNKKLRTRNEKERESTKKKEEANKCDKEKGRYRERQTEERALQRHSDMIVDRKKR